MNRFYSYIIAITSIALFLLLITAGQSYAVSSITVSKSTGAPTGFEGFQFTFTGPGNNTQFTLDDGETRGFTDLEPGTYTVTETNIPEGFELFSITHNSCQGTTVSTDEENAEATINLADNCDMTIGFINLGTSTIQIIKETVPADSEQEFDFTSDIPGIGNFTATDGGGITVLSVAPGTYTVQEELTAGFTLTNINCNDPAASTDLEERTATIVIEDNDNVACTFTNTANGGIIIQKETVPMGGEGFGFAENITGDDGTFTLDDGQSEEFLSVPPGEYTVTEDDPVMSPGGFFLTDIVCDDMGSTTDLETRTATIDVDQEEVVTCKFTNTSLLQGLNLIKEDSPDPVVAGEELTYQITVVNEAETSATDALLVDTLPDGVVPVSIVSDTLGVNCQFDDVEPIEPQTATCNIGTLDPDQEVNITIVVIPDPDVFDDAPEIITNLATLTAEPGPAEREASTQTLVNPIVDLEITPNRENRLVERNESFEVSYEVTVNPLNMNAVSSLRSTDPVVRADALNVLLDIEFSDLFEVESVETTQGDCVIGSIQCTLGNILEGQTVIVTIIFTAPDENGNFDIDATVSSLGQSFTDRVIVRVRNDNNSNCSLAASGAAASVPLYLFIPLFILIRRVMRKENIEETNNP